MSEISGFPHQLPSTNTPPFLFLAYFFSLFLISLPFYHTKQSIKSNHPLRASYRLSRLFLPNDRWKSLSYFCFPIHLEKEKRSTKKCLKGLYCLATCQLNRNWSIEQRKNTEIVICNHELWRVKTLPNLRKKIIQHAFTGWKWISIFTRVTTQQV